MINKKILNFSYIQIFLILSYTICWFSISTSFYDIVYFVEKKNTNLNTIINFLRQLLNLIIFPILIIIFLKKCRRINFKNELLFVSALLYFLSQIPGLLFTDNSFTNIIYIISALNILLIFVLTNIYFDEKKYVIFFYIIILMLSLITLLNYKTFVHFVSSESSFTLYTFFNSSETFLGKQSPRSTGSSRTLLLLMIITFLFFNKNLKKNNFLKMAIYFLISTFILLFQSRTTIALLITFILFNYIYEKKFSLRETLKYLVTYILMPVIFVYFVLIFKQLIHNKEILDNFYKQSISTSLSEITTNFQRPIDPQTYSSGRINDWKEILMNFRTNNKLNAPPIHMIKKSVIYGYGAQGDRYLINQTASNGIIYSLSSSGILGTIPFIFFSILSVWVVLRILFENLKLRIPITNYSAIIVILILLRSLLESSYAVFSIDLIVIYTFLNYLNKFYSKNNNGN